MYDNTKYTEVILKLIMCVCLHKIKNLKLTSANKSIQKKE